MIDYIIPNLALVIFALAIVVIDPIELIKQRRERKRRELQNQKRDILDKGFGGE